MRLKGELTDYANLELPAFMSTARRVRRKGLIKNKEDSVSQLIILLVNVGRDGWCQALKMRRGAECFAMGD